MTIESKPYREQVARDQVTVFEQRLGYQLYEVDARPVGAGDSGCLQGNLNVFIPGHWQKARTAQRLLQGIAAESDSGLVWSLDIDPPQGGDPVRAAALVEILRQRIASRFTYSQDPLTGETGAIRVTLFGWSHGGAEALRAVELAPDLFDRLLLLCPAGLVERRCAELSWSFTLEGLRIFLRALGKSWATVGIVLRIVAGILAGLAGDLFQARSLQRVAGDIGWICHKVPRPDFRYPGEVVILFGAQDTVIRWQDVFPTAMVDLGEIVSDLSRIPEVDLADYKLLNFPYASRLEVFILPGDHASPETEPDPYLQIVMQTMRN